MINTCKLLFQRLLSFMRGLGRRISQVLKKKNNGHVVMASGFVATLMAIVGVFLFTSNADYNVAADSASDSSDVVNDEKIFELDLDEDVREELKKGFSSLYDTVSTNHAEKIYNNIADNFVPFGKDVYEVLSNKKDGSATLEENGKELVMADNGSSADNGQAQNNTGDQNEVQQEPVTEVQTEPVTEAPTELVTEAPTEPVTEAPTEPVTEAPTEPVTEAPTEPVTEQVTESDPFALIYTGQSVDVSADPYYSGYVYNVTEDEYYWLTHIVEAEAGNQDDVGKILVANVILNRVNSGSFPGNIIDVIFQARGSVYQFQPVKNGMIYSVTPSSHTLSCVDRALNGEDYSWGALYFAQQTSRYSWFNTSLTLLFVYGPHYFYK